MIAARRPWLESEIAAVLPQVIVCLGATAAQDLLGLLFRLTKHRVSHHVRSSTATIHPAAILCVPEPAAKEAEIASLVSDLKAAAQYAPARRDK